MLMALIKPKLIEFVCTANHGRSPVAELIAQNYLKSIGAAGAYQAASSGSLVDDINAGKVSPKFMQLIVEQALGRGDIYAAGDAPLAKQAVQDGNESVLKHYYDQAVAQFQAAESTWREDALAYFGIAGKLKTTHDQTLPRPDIIAVLPMADRNTAQVRDIYRGSGYHERHFPVIESVGPFATGRQDAAVPDAFGRTKESYLSAIEMLTRYVPQSIDKLLG